MEFRFDLSSLLKANIVRITSNLIPEGLTGDRRSVLYVFATGYIQSANWSNSFSFCFAEMPSRKYRKSLMTWAMHRHVLKDSTNRWRPLRSYETLITSFICSQRRPAKSKWRLGASPKCICTFYGDFPYFSSRAVSLSPRIKLTISVELARSIFSTSITTENVFGQNVTCDSWLIDCVEIVHCSSLRTFGYYADRHEDHHVLSFIAVHSRGVSFARTRLRHPRVIAFETPSMGVNHKANRFA